MTRRTKAFFIALLIVTGILAPSIIACDNDINGFKCPAGQTIVRRGNVLYCE